MMAAAESNHELGGREKRSFEVLSEAFKDCGC